jgi:excisionase family DNA binding protein
VTERLAYRVHEAAEHLGISRSKAYQLIAAGQLPVLRIGGSVRVPAEALKEWIARQVTATTE